jgi:hypothetical protein
MALTKIPASLLDTSSGINGLIYPSSDGTAGQFLKTDGSGNLTFATTYTDSDVETYLDGGTSTPTFASATVSGALTVTGDLNITGDINSYNVTDLDVTDQTITLGAGQIEANSGGSGIIVDGSNASILWDETNDTFDINKGIDVTGTITADGLNVSTATGTASPTPTTAYITTESFGSDWSAVNPWGRLAFYSSDGSGGGGKPHVVLDATASNVIGASSSFSVSTTSESANTLTKRLNISSGGDISFYEDTGTTAKLFWDASTESLNLNGTSGLVIDNSAINGALSITNPSADLIQFTTGTNDDIAFVLSGSERVRFDSSGNVGIGTNNPNSKTHIVGAANAIALRVTNAAVDGNNADVMHIEPSNAAYYGKLLRIQSGRSDFSDSLLFLNTTTGMNATNGSYMRVQNNSGADIFRIKGDGNVGIGTTNPVADLTISNAGAEGIEFYAANGGNINATQHYNRSGSVYVTNKVIAADHQFLIGGTERMRLNSAGSLGLGTNNPSARLHLYNSSSDPINIGIQNSTRYYKLEVNSGDLQFFDISAYVERMRITSNGVLAVGAATTYQNGSSGVYGRLGVQHTTSQDVSTAVFLNKSNSLTNYTSTFTDGSYTSNTANYSFYTCFTGNGSTISDVEYYLRGDGNAYADGAWNGGGADYAEYFEWEDGNSGSEDRRGWSVVLVNEKIRRATSDDDASTIIGVISGNPGVVGDSDIQGKWKGKYLTDDFGTPIRENVQAYSWETTDAEGNITTHSMHEDRVPEGVTVPTVEENSTFTSTTVDRKRDNPAYVEGQEYVQREYRPEWDTVGLMGKLRILKTEQKGTNWIKMRDISDAVEEWLVR